MLRWRCIPEPCHTTSEPRVGNSPPGAPVTVLMSDGFCRNQGGTVEYISYPTPDSFQGVGIFYTFLPNYQKEENTNGKQLHL